MLWLDRCNPQLHAAGAVRQDFPWRDARRTLHDHEILLFASGFSGSVDWDGGVVRIRGGDWVLIPPGVAHTCRGDGPRGPWRGWIHFDWDHGDGPLPQLMTYAPAVPRRKRVRAAPPWVPLRGITIGVIRNPDEVRGLHGQLVACWRLGGKAGGRGLLLELLLRLLGEGGTDVGGQRGDLAMKVRETLDFVAAQPFGRSDALRTALRRLDRSPDHCARAFRGAFGIAPARYLAVQRMRRAQELLLSGLSPVEAAEALGFDDPGYFNRVFRNATGMPPGQWRRRLTYPEMHT